MFEEKQQISVTSQEEIFTCCVCSKEVAPYESYIALGSHIDCARTPNTMNQLLRNYLFLLKKEITRTSKHAVGDIEFYNDEIKRVEQARKEPK